MSAVDLALAVGEASLRAAPALIVLLTLRTILARRTSPRVSRALMLAGVLAVPSLPAVAAVAPALIVSPPRPAQLSGLARSAPWTDAAPILNQVVTVVALIWLIGAAVMLARTAAGLARVRRGVRAAKPLEHPAWRADADRIAQRLGLSRPPELRVSREECLPHAWGWIRPLVVIPPSATNWSAERRFAVLAHEIGHLARNEPLARLATECARAIHWFDPLLRAAVAAFRRDSELTADEAALSLGIDRRDYAGHLLAVARERLARPAPRVIPAIATPGRLERRVQQILATRGHRPRPPSPSSRAGRAGIPALALALVGLTAIPRLDTPESVLARWSERYSIPVELAARIVAAAEREGVDTGVAFGLIAEESEFDSGRTSASGAIGLTQVLPSTAMVVAPGLSVDQLRDDSVNLSVGLRYLRAQIEREGGSVVHGLAAYALGPRRLDDLRRDGRAVPTEYPARVLAHLD